MVKHIYQGIDIHLCLPEVSILLRKSFWLYGGIGMGHYVRVESGVKLYVEDLNPGGSKTIVFLHGWPLNHQQFEYQFDVLACNGIPLYWN